MEPKQIRTKIIEISQEKITLQILQVPLVRILVIPIMIISVLMFTVFFADNDYQLPKFIFGGLSILMLVLLFIIDVREMVEINLNDKSIKFNKYKFSSWIGFPQKHVKEYRVINKEYFYVYDLFHNQGVEIETDNGNYQFFFPAPRKKQTINEDQIHSLLNTKEKPGKELFMAASQFSASESAVGDSDQIKTNKTIEKMKKDIRSWGNSSLLLGAVHLISFGVLAPSWGVILLLVGLASFIFEGASLFVVYAVSLAWVGISNMIQSDLGFWTFFALYQIFLAYRVFKRFGFYRDAEQKLIEYQGEDTRSKKIDPEKHFPWMSIAFSWGALIIFLVIFIMIIIAVAAETDLDPISKFIDLVFNILIGFGVIGVAFSLSAILSRYKRKWMAWLGLAGGALLLAINFLLFYS